MQGITKILVSAGIAASALAMGLGSAVADPPAGVTPAPSDIVSVGSDTIQNVEDQLSLDYNKANTSGPQFYSYDAVPAAAARSRRSPAARRSPARTARAPASPR